MRTAIEKGKNFGRTAATLRKYSGQACIGIRSAAQCNRSPKCRLRSLQLARDHIVKISERLKCLGTGWVDGRCTLITRGGIGKIVVITVRKLDQISLHAE